MKIDTHPHKVSTPPNGPMPTINENRKLIDARNQNNRMRKMVRNQFEMITRHRQNYIEMRQEPPRNKGLSMQGLRLLFEINAHAIRSWINGE